MSETSSAFLAAGALLICAAHVCGQSVPGGTPPREPAAGSPAAYVLGPDDQVTIWALGLPELSDKPVRIDPGGFLDLPLIGRVHAERLTVAELRRELINRLRTYVQEPSVSVNVTEYHSQPVSVIGAVNEPGIHQVQGRHTLVELLSLAGGVRTDAGNTIKITRRLEQGRIPLPGAQDDPSGQFSIAEVNLRQVMEARNPADNILIRPFDVISVPSAQMIYVMGEVNKPGGFPLNERENFTVLQALSMAGGLTRMASPKSARILRAKPGAGNRQEMALNLKPMLAGTAQDLPLAAEDILFIPNSTPKAASLRVLEAAISMGTGLVIWRR